MRNYEKKNAFLRKILYIKYINAAHLKYIQSIAQRKHKNVSNPLNERNPKNLQLHKLFYSLYTQFRTIVRLLRYLEPKKYKNQFEHQLFRVTLTKLRKPCGRPLITSRLTGTSSLFSFFANITQSSRHGSISTD